MHSWVKLLVTATLPLALAACLWGPGKFTSNLALSRAGSFILDYQGEIMLQVPDGREAASPWNDGMARCYVDGQPEFSEEVAPADNSDDASTERELRSCTPAETAGLKARHAQQSADRAARKTAENEQMARLMGMPGLDDESNRRFAASLMKHKGWRSVRYEGKGLFKVDYHFEGRLDQEFVFPLMPDSDLLIPFITIRPRNDGSVRVSAPAFVGGAGTFAARARAMGLPDKSDGPPSRAEGRFTVMTDGEILTNNSEDGPTAVAGGRQLSWDVGPASQKVPELLINLGGKP